MITIKMAPYGEPPEDHGYVPVDLLEQIPSLMLLIIKTGHFPSQKVLNDLFSRGEFDSGMSGGVSWEAFSVDLHDWQDIKIAIADRHQIIYQEFDEEANFKNYDEWAENILSLIAKTSSR
ncbi:MAG: hypothetical protein JXR16_08085 [Bermanella sp.]